MMGDGRVQSLNKGVKIRMWGAIELTREIHKFPPCDLGKFTRIMLTEWDNVNRRKE